MMVDRQRIAASGLLWELAKSGQISRRELLRRAGSLGLSASAIAVLLIACGGDDEESAPTPAQVAAFTPTPRPAQSAATTVAPTPTQSSARPEVAAQPTLTPSGRQPAKDQTLVYAEGSENRSIDPGNATEGNAWHIISSAYEGLVSQVTGSAEIAPRLAKSWTISDDARVFTFTLNQGVRFHDEENTLLNAAVVKKSIERTIQINRGPAATFEIVDQMNVLDDFTIQFVLKEPHAYFVENLTTQPIVSPIFEKHDVGGDLGAAWLEEHTAGTGPYRLTERRRNERTTLDRFDGYWRGWDGNHLDQLVFPVVPETSSRRQMLERGDVHFIGRIPANDVQALSQLPGIAVKVTPSFEYYTIPLNIQKPPLDNPRVRQAIKYAFPYEDFLKRVWLGNGTIPSGPLAPGAIGYDPTLPPWTQDLDQAKQLLADAGVSGATMNAFYVETLPEERESVTVLQQALKSLGIDLQVQGMVWATMFELVHNLETAPHMSNLILGGEKSDPTFTLNWSLGCEFVGKPYNWSYYCVDQFQNLITQARSTADRAKSVEFIQQAVRLVVDEAPIIWYGQPHRNDAYSDRVQNFVPHVIGYPNQVDFYALWLAE